MIRVFVVSEIALYREGLCEILARQDRIKVVGAAAAIDAACESFDQLEQPPDVVLLDIVEPASLSLVGKLIASVPTLSVLAIAVPNRESDIIACVESGVSGLVTRDASLESLVAAIEAVAEGEMLCSPKTAALLLRRVRALAGDRSAAALTVREREIVQLIAEGFSNKQIARDLRIELPTVKNHVHHILDKLGVHSRTEAVARLRRAAMVQME